MFYFKSFKDLELKQDDFCLYYMNKLPNLHFIALKLNNFRNYNGQKRILQIDF